jgi:hypothetical protein
VRLSDICGSKSPIGYMHGIQRLHRSSELAAANRPLAWRICHGVKT